MRRLDSITNSINGHEFEQFQETVKEQRSLAYPWDGKESGTT